MKTISSGTITEVVSRLCHQANYYLPEDVLRALDHAYTREESERAREIIEQIRENARIAAHKEMALCQDTGIAEIFVTMGSGVSVTGSTLPEAIQEGVARGYTTGFLRTSMVCDPLRRVNTGDNTPATITIDIVAGDGLSITILPKGGGTENASVVTMMAPNTGMEGLMDCVVETVKTKGMNACPPLIIGVGVGGSFSTVAGLAKKALLRPIGSPAIDDYYATIEKRVLSAINALGIGPMGLGGVTTALAVHIQPAPCHIASLPVAVNMQCHCMRRLTEVI